MEIVINEKFGIVFSSPRPYNPRVYIFDNAQRMSFSTSNRFLCSVFIYKIVEKPDS